MDGKKYFHECCNKLNIDSDTLFKFGVGKSSIKDRYVYKCPHTSRTSTQKYAIKYFENDNLYIAWNLKEFGFEKKSTFTLQRMSTIEHTATMISKITKPIEYKGRGEEIVLVFSPKCVIEFLEKYIEGE